MSKSLSQSVSYIRHIGISFVKAFYKSFLIIFLCNTGFFVPSAFGLPNSDIIFVTQIPIPNDFATVNSTFGNQDGDIAVRGFGDLYIRYADGTLRNLTAAAGYGNEGRQGATSIAVRDPSVNFSGNKVIFSMVIGAPTQQYQVNDYFWQLYEITNFGQNQTPVITKVANQPTTFNNVMPVYASDGETIIFASDRPRNGASHLYPQRDEYESAATNTGLWSLKPASNELKLLDHSPSGDFHPIIDSFGRLVFTRWDHLQRDQQSDNESGVLKEYGAFNYSDEGENATHLNSIAEYFPEHQDSEAQAEENPKVAQHRFNQFFPWAMNQDGTNLETISHIGRHELHGYIPKTFQDDSSLDDFYGQYSRTNQNSIENFLQIKEDPTSPGKYFGIDCPEFGTHSAGQIVSLVAPPDRLASTIQVTYVTDRSTASTSDSPGPEHSGLYRNPLPLSDGTLIVSHTSATAQDANIGTSSSPQSKYSFRLKTVVAGSGSYKVAGSALTTGITKNISYWSPDELVSYNGTVWELQPVEIISRTTPSSPSENIEQPELTAITDGGTSVTALKDYLSQNNLALIVGRNITTRDAADIEQPFNIKVENGVQTLGDSGKIYTVKYLQLFQGDQIRGYSNSNTGGRRVLAVPLHDSISFNPTDSNGPVGNVRIATDGSFSALVPARRALSWQMTDAQGVPVVRERYWLTFQPGEIRMCASCHGITSHSQVGGDVPTNTPKALTDLLKFVSGLPVVTPSPTASPSPTPSTSISFSISKPKVGGGVANYTISVKGSKSDTSSLALRLSISAKACARATKRVKLSSKGKATLTMSLPQTVRLQHGTLSLYINGAENTSKVLRIPANRFSGSSKASVRSVCRSARWGK